MGDLLIHDGPGVMNGDIAARAERNGTRVSDETELLQKAKADVPEQSASPHWQRATQKTSWGLISSR